MMKWMLVGHRLRRVSAKDGGYSSGAIHHLDASN
jgi:hypothetical protein